MDSSMTPRGDQTTKTDHDRIIELETNFDNLKENTGKSEERITGEIKALRDDLKDIPSEIVKQMTPVIQQEAHKAASKQVEKHAKNCAGKERVSLKDRLLDWRLILIMVLAGGTGGGGGKIAEKIITILGGG